MDKVQCPQCGFRWSPSGNSATITVDLDLTGTTLVGPEAVDEFLRTIGDAVKRRRPGE